MDETLIVELVIKHLAGQHNQVDHARKTRQAQTSGDRVSIKERIKRVAPYIVAVGTSLGALGALSAAGKYADIRDKQDEAVQGFKNDIDAKFAAAHDVRLQGQATTDPEFRQGLLDAADRLESEYHNQSHMKNWSRSQILDYLYKKYSKRNP